MSKSKTKKFEFYKSLKITETFLTNWFKNNC